MRKKRPTIAILMPGLEHSVDCATLERFLGANYDTIRIACLGQTEKVVGGGKVDLVICEACLSGGGWKDVLEIIRNHQSNPKLIVCSRLAGDRLWSEVLNLGGYDVLAKPFDKEEVRRVVGMATTRKSVLSAKAFR